MKEKNMFEDMKLIKQALHEAGEIMKQLPPSKRKAYILLTPELGIIDKFSPEYAPLKPVIIPNSADLLLLDTVLEWLRPLSSDETKLVWMRSCGFSWKDISREFQRHRSCLNEKYNMALGKIWTFITFRRITENGNQKH